MFEQNGYRVGSIAGIDISISTGYVFIMVLIVVLNFGIHSVLFALAITLSVLIHELGHAVVCKFYNLSPSILLHGFGGLCFHDRAKTDSNDALIVVAGPVVEIIFGIGAFGALIALPMPELVGTFVYLFAWISVVWGAINLLLPLWPLDGGRLFNLILRRFIEERKAQDWTLKVSVTVAIPAGIVGILAGHFFVAFLAFFLIMDNVNSLRSGADLVGRKGKERSSEFVTELLADAERALQKDDWREAYRVCHQIRSGNDEISSKDLERVYEILGVTAVRLEEWDEAQGWLERAPNTDQVAAARQVLAAHVS